jgi:hypothetical protein
MVMFRFSLLHFCRMFGELIAAILKFYHLGQLLCSFAARSVKLLLLLQTHAATYCMMRVTYLIRTSRLD